MEQANRLSGEDMDGAAVCWMGAGHWTTVDFISAGATYSRHSKVRHTLSAILIFNHSVYLLKYSTCGYQFNNYNITVYF